MNDVTAEAIEEAEVPAEPARPLSRAYVVAIVGIGYLAAAGAVLATLLLPVR